MAHAELRTVLRRVGVTLLVACVVPAVVFASLFTAFGIWPAIGAALCWSYGAIAVRALAGRSSAMLLLTTGVLTVRTVVAFAADSPFIYFLQPVLVDLAVGAAFLTSLSTRRPMAARLAGDFYPLTDEQQARPPVRRLFRRLTVLWGVAALAKATVVFTLLMTQPLATIVVTKAILMPLTNASCLCLTLITAISVARSEGLLPERTARLRPRPMRATS